MSYLFVLIMFIKLLLYHVDMKAKEGAVVYYLHFKAPFF